jgi:hypothetical protein
MKNPALTTFEPPLPARAGAIANAAPGKTGPRSLVLVHPPQKGLLEGFASGLAALANYVTGRLPSVSVQLLDLGLATSASVRRQIKKAVSRNTGQLFVGITATTASYQSALMVADLFKRLSPGCVVIIGGHHASAQDTVILRNHNYIDCVVRGEGEIALVELLKQYPELGHVPNLAYRRGLDIERNEQEAPRLPTQELDSIPPTYQGWGLRTAPGKFDHTTYVSARGCPLRCAFCAVSNAIIHAKSITAIIKDLRFLVGKMGYSRIAIEDNFFAHNPKRTIELCRAIEHLQRELPFRWDCQTRVESCKQESVLEAMERAGCEAVYLGVESFDPEQLLYLNKTRQPGNYLNLLRDNVVPWLLRSTVNCYVNLQLGLPGEAAPHRANNIRFLTALGHQAEMQEKRITVFPMMHVVYPGTAHFDQALIECRFGPDSASVFERFTAWEARQQPILRWLGEHFAHGTGGIPEGILHADRLRRGEFEVDPSAVFEVINQLTAMARLPGIEVFQYGKHLAGQGYVAETEAQEASN